MKIKPLFDRVVLKLEESESETKSGIFLPTSAKEKSQIGKVVAVGEGGTLDGKEQKMLVKVGDRVLFSKYAGTEIEDGKEKYTVLRQIDILGIVE